MGLYEIAIIGGNGIALWMLGLDRWLSLFFFEFGVGLFLLLYREIGQPELSYLQAAMLAVGGLVCMYLAFRQRSEGFADTAADEQDSRGNSPGRVSVESSIHHGATTGSNPCASCLANSNCPCGSDS